LFLLAAQATESVSPADPSISPPLLSPSPPSAPDTALKEGQVHGGHLQELQRLPLFAKLPPVFISLQDHEAATERFWQMQHPADCSRRKVHLMALPNGGGMGRALNIFAMALQAAWNKNATAVLDTLQTWEWANKEAWCASDGRRSSLGYSCYFRTFSGCQGYLLSRTTHPNLCTSLAFRNHTPGCKGRANPWHNGHALAYIVRPNARLQKWLLQQYISYWHSPIASAAANRPRESLIAVHIRWGDKLVETELSPVTNYLDKVLEIAQRFRITNPVVLLSSEDGSAIELFQDAVQQHPMSVLVYNYYRPSMNCGSINVRDALGANGTGTKRVWDRSGAYGTRYKRMRKSLYKNTTMCMSTLELKEVSRNHSESLTLISILNLFLALETSHIVCSERSNWCALLEDLASVLRRNPRTVVYKI
jgi:hypothetical protein